ncbi:hypothetical protein PMAYCL1PPCAC_30138, partial [Pristionchus mayeri]
SDHPLSFLLSMSSNVDRSSEAAAKNKIKKRRNPRKSTQYISLNARKEPSKEIDEPSMPPTPLSPLSPHSSSSAPFSFPSSGFSSSSRKSPHSPSHSSLKFTFSHTLSIRSSDPVSAPERQNPPHMTTVPSTTVTPPTDRPVPPPRRNRNRRHHHVVVAPSDPRPEPIVTHL